MFNFDRLFCNTCPFFIVYVNEKCLSNEEELTRDVMEIMTVFCAKLYGRRSHKSKKMAEAIENIVSEAEQKQKGNLGNL